MSVVIRTRRGAATQVRDSLYAVAALVHTDPQAIVIIDDTSPSTADAVSRLVSRLAGLVDARVCVCPGADEDPALAFNAGVDASGAEFVTFTDAGEVLYPRHARLLGDALRASPTAVVAYGAGYRAWGRFTHDAFVCDTKQRWGAEPLDPSRVDSGRGIALSAAMVRREVLDAAGIRFRPGRSTETLLRDLAVLGPFTRVDVAVCEHRMVDGDPPTWPAAISRQPAAAGGPSPA